jgi:hypothetical protein
VNNENSKHKILSKNKFYLFVFIVMPVFIAGCSSDEFDCEYGKYANQDVVDVKGIDHPI